MAGDTRFDRVYDLYTQAKQLPLIEEFVKGNLGEYRIKGKEAMIKTCPFCGRNKNKFYLNIETGLYSH